MTDALNHAPVPLGAGSYDYDALKDALDVVAASPVDQRDTAIADTLKELDATKLAAVDARDTPGYVFKDVENKDLGVTETIQVFADGDAQQQAELDAAAAEKPAAKNGNGKAAAATTGGASAPATSGE